MCSCRLYARSDSICSLLPTGLKLVFSSVLGSAPLMTGLIASRSISDTILLRKLQI